MVSPTAKEAASCFAQHHSMFHPFSPMAKSAQSKRDVETQKPWSYDQRMVEWGFRIIQFFQGLSTRLWPRLFYICFLWVNLLFQKLPLLQWGKPMVKNGLLGIWSSWKSDASAVLRVELRCGLLSATLEAHLRRLVPHEFATGVDN